MAKHDWDHGHHGRRLSDISNMGRRICRICGASQERHPQHSWMRVTGYRWEPLVGRCPGERYYWEHDGGEYYVVDREDHTHGRVDTPRDRYLTKAERRHWAQNKAARMNDAERAYRIAQRCELHREAIEEIMHLGMASDKGEADELIREGEAQDRGRP